MILPQGHTLNESEVHDICSQVAERRAVPSGTLRNSSTIEKEDMEAMSQAFCQTMKTIVRQ